MPERVSLLTKTFTHIFNTVKDMAQPEGTSINELVSKLSINKRSVHRIIRNMENNLNIPIIAERKEFGGITKYFLPQSFTDKLSHITLPEMQLSFNEAMTIYLIITTCSLQKEENNYFQMLRKTIELAIEN
jgi:hypothetical protein